MFKSATVTVPASAVPVTAWVFPQRAAALPHACRAASEDAVHLIAIRRNPARDFQVSLQDVDHGTYPAMAAPCRCSRDEQGELFIFSSLSLLLFSSTTRDGCALPLALPAGEEKSLRAERAKNELEQFPLFIPRATARRGHRGIRPMVYSLEGRET
jgi:hypothetical protein